MGIWGFLPQQKFNNYSQCKEKLLCERFIGKTSKDSTIVAGLKTA